jgi:hypothetical protein
MLIAVTAVGIVAAVPTTLSHRQKRKGTKTGFLLKMARARRKKSKQLADTATAYPTSTSFSAR